MCANNQLGYELLQHLLCLSLIVVFTIYRRAVMSRVNWDRVAKQQFDAMPKEFQEDWGELRGVVYDNI